MASAIDEESLRRLWASIDHHTISSNPQIVAFLIILFSSLAYFSIARADKSDPPLFNKPGGWKVINYQVEADFRKNGRVLFDKAVKMYPENPFRLLTDLGEVTILPAKFADEIRSAPQLDPSKFLTKMLPSSLPGFEIFREGTSEAHMAVTVTRKKLTQNFGRVTDAVSQECAFALPKILSEDEEWHQISVRESLLQLVARLSSRVFLGQELCRDQEWLDITTRFVTAAFGGAYVLRLVPNFLRPLIYYLVPVFRKAHVLSVKAHELVTPVVDKRRRQKAELRAQGEDPNQFNDALEWFEHEAQSQGYEYDASLTQLIIAAAAIFTSTDLITQVLLDLSQHPEMIEPLRAEISKVFDGGEVNKQLIHSLKLLDSVMKESLRLKPTSLASMRRGVVEDLTLSDGTFLKKGSLVAVSAQKLRDPSTYPDPDTFDGFRFYRLGSEKAGQEVRSQLTSTGPDYLAFGHGQHACPGRFFASVEVKIALCHILFKYDIKPVEDYEPKLLYFGLNILPDPKAKIWLRKRKE